MNKSILSISFIFIILFSISGIAFPWEIKTHEEISENAINTSEMEQYCENNLGFSLSSKRFQGPVHTDKNTLPIEQFSDDKTYTATEWIKHGSGAEDEFFNRTTHVARYRKDMRPVNHFYNPFWNNSNIYPYPNDGWGNDWLFQQGGLYDDLFNDIPPFPLGISIGKPSPKWTFDGCPDTPPNSDFTRSNYNYFSWIYARKYFYAALSGDSTELDGIGGIEGKINMNENERDRCFALLFRSLGQLIHLIQDAGQPEHTRNDGHPLNSYIPGFESYASEQAFNDPSWATDIPWPLIVKTENPENPIYDFFASDHSGSADYSTASSTGLAEFSNYNFLTKDSIADNLMHDYCEPDCEPQGHERHRFFTHPRINENSSTLEEGFIYDTHYYRSEPIADPLGISPAQSIRLAKRKWYHNLLLLHGWRDYTTEDKKVWDDYLKLLIPKCVGYSAGLLDYFFRGSLEVTTCVPFIYDNKIVSLNVKAKNVTDSEETMSEGNFTVVVRYTPVGGNPDGSEDQFFRAEDVYCNELQYEDELEFTVDLPLPGSQDSISFDVYESIKCYLVFKGTLGEEEGAVIGKVFTLGEIKFREDWDNGLNGNHDWAHGQSPTEPVEGGETINNITTANNQDTLIKENIRYAGVEDGRSNQSALSLGGGNEILITPNTFLHFKIDNFSVTPPSTIYLQALRIQFANGTWLQFCPDGQCDYPIDINWPPMDININIDSENALVTVNIHQLFQEAGIAIPEYLYLSYMNFIQLFEEGAGPATTQRMEIDFIRIVEETP